MQESDDFNRKYNKAKKSKAKNVSTNGDKKQEDKKQEDLLSKAKKRREFHKNIVS